MFYYNIVGLIVLGVSLSLKRIQFNFYSICCFLFLLWSVCARVGGINQFILLIDDLISHTVAICARTGHQIILYLHNQSARGGGGASSLSVSLPPFLSLSLSQTRL